jgi:hypothetical protein
MPHLLHKEYDENDRGHLGGDGRLHGGAKDDGRSCASTFCAAKSAMAVVVANATRGVECVRDMCTSAVF